MGLDSVEFVVALEEKYSISIPDVDAPSLGVLGDLCNYIVRASMNQNGVALSADVVFEQVSEILVESYGVPRNQIRVESHVVRDLGLD